ncbi:hypothetical protein CANARDRAFT_9480 [[Candida] arabinofermentans NRRL YB-2248]|uniref:Uncharacterized protein n=1 Tax=[Candida] arabinofermentans NRRL YB-2248 TaxID=983967 RepID=A0A1E4SVY7_9ASCO|nr:hypothetical protein CANARDRAFT_9480 [[Candida] arabinofermentans NRRL YB-2248]
MSRIPLTEELIGILTDSHALTNLQLVHINETTNDETDPIEELFKNHNFPTDFNSKLKKNEILITKQTLIKIFLECRTNINQNRVLDLNEEYLTTMGTLLVTPEDHTIISRNEDVFLKMIDQKSDNSTILLNNHLRTLAGFLDSNIARTNKSSNLWLYFQKTLIRSISKNMKNNIDVIVKLLDWSTDVLLESIRNHPRNYYALQTLKFVICIMYSNLLQLSSTNDDDALVRQKQLLVTTFEKLLEFMRRWNVNDPSIWGILGLLFDSWSVSGYVYGTIDRISHGVLLLKFSYSSPECDRYTLIKKWLTVGNGVATFYGWESLLKLAEYNGSREMLLKEFEASFTKFEIDHCCRIDIECDSMIVDGSEVNLQEDLILLEEFRLNLIKKKLVTRKLPIF